MEIYPPEDYSVTYDVAQGWQIPLPPEQKPLLVSGGTPHPGYRHLPEAVAPKIFCLYWPEESRGRSEVDSGRVGRLEQGGGSALNAKGGGGPGRWAAPAGPILGNHPMDGRTERELSSHLPAAQRRHLGDVQMTTEPRAPLDRCPLAFRRFALCPLGEQGSGEFPCSSPPCWSLIASYSSRCGPLRGILEE